VERLIGLPWNGWPDCRGIRTDIIGTVVGLVILVVMGIPVLSLAITAAITVITLQVAIVVAILGYLVGIPWSIWFRWRHGRWPEG